MKPDMSEFSYGYAIVEQIARNNTFPFTAAPVFPSLIQEGQQGGGYDAALQLGGVPLFLQFKLSDHLARANAKEADDLGLPCYRMHLRSKRHSDQHEMLLDLENSGELVFYVAPMFHLPEELNDAYLNRQVIQCSMFIKPSTIGGPPDDQEYYVVFNDSQDLLVCSEPKKVEKGSFGPEIFIKEAIRQTELGKRRANNHFDMEELSNRMIQIVERSKEKGFWTGVDPRTLRSDREPLIHTAYLARTFLDCEMFALRYRDQQFD